MKSVYTTSDLISRYELLKDEIETLRTINQNTKDTYTKKRKLLYRIVIEASLNM